MNRNFVPIERAALDGTLREMYPQISPEHWSWWIYTHSCLSGKSGETYAGHSAAKNHCGVSFHTLGLESLSPTDKTSWLYQPFLDAGLASVAGSVISNGRDCQVFALLSSQATSAPGKPFTTDLRRSADIPFVMLPNTLFRGAWATLTHPEQRWVCAVYAFLVLKEGIVNPNHLRVENGRLVTSPAFDRAAGATGSRSVELLVTLTAKGLVSTVDTSLRIADEYPGSRSPLSLAAAPVSLRDTGIHAHLVVPTLALDPDNARKAAAR